jgi:uncharacterized membrane protein YkoI
MDVVRPLAAAMLVLAMLAPSSASEPIGACLRKEQRRAVIASGQVVRLAAAIRTVHARRGGEVIKARLCKGPNGFVYVLTLLARDGKVTRTTVDATNGAVLGSR